MITEIEKLKYCSDDTNFYYYIDEVLEKLYSKNHVDTFLEFIKRNPDFKYKNDIVISLFDNFYDYDWNKNHNSVAKKINIMTHIRICKELIKNYDHDIKTQFEKISLNYLVSIPNAMLFLKTFKKYIIINRTRRYYQVETILDACKYGTLDTVKYLWKYENRRNTNIMFAEDVISNAFENKNTNVLDFVCNILQTNKICFDFIYISNKITFKKIKILLKYFYDSRNSICSYSLKNVDFKSCNCLNILTNYDFELLLNEYENLFNLIIIENNDLFEIVLKKTKSSKDYNSMIYSKCVNMVIKNKYIITPDTKKYIETYLVDTNIRKKFIYTVLDKIIYVDCDNKFDKKLLMSTFDFLLKLNDYNYLHSTYFNYYYAHKVSEIVYECLFMCGINLTKLYTPHYLRNYLTNPVFLKYYRAHYILYKRIKKIIKQKHLTHKLKFTPIINTLPKPLSTLKPKRIFPIHFNRLNFIQFLIKNREFYIAPKADGIYEMINLSMYYPYIDLYHIGKINFESEKMAYNINYVFGNYEDQLKLRTLHEATADLSSSHYKVNNLDELIYIIEKEKEIIKKFLDENKNTDETLWYPKLMVKIVNPEAIDYDSLLKISFDTDGWIFTSFKQDEIFKMKPREHLTIDLVCRDNKYFSYNNTEFENININPTNKNNGIYRCYYNNALEVWEPREERIDKKTPNSNDIIIPIINYFKNPWKYNVLLCQYTKYYTGDFYYNKDKVVYNSFKHWIPDIEGPMIEKYLNGNVLDLGCGFRNIVNTKEFIGIDSKIIERPNVYLSNMNQNWKSTLKQFYNIDLKRVNTLLCINAIHFIEDIKTFRKNLSETTHKGTIFIIRYLDKDLLKKLDLPIQYKENYVNYTNDNRDTIKYYYSHCHNTCQIEKLVDLKHYLEDWELIDTNIAQCEPDDHPWKKYLNCFRVGVFRRL